jgi:hypothetical protein
MTGWSGSVAAKAKPDEVKDAALGDRLGARTWSSTLLGDEAVRRRIPVVAVVVLAALSLASAGLAVLLDRELTRWAATHPFLFALVGALLTVPLTALVTAVVVEALLSAHERARARAVCQARIVRLGIVAAATLSAFARALLEPGAVVADPAARHPGAHTITWSKARCSTLAVVAA